MLIALRGSLKITEQVVQAIICVAGIHQDIVNNLFQSMFHFGDFVTNRCLPKFTELDISQNSCGLFGRLSAHFILLYSKLIGQFGIIYRISYWRRS